MDVDRSMYLWRQWTPEQREEALGHRQRNHLPWHGPPHYENDEGLYMITAACYEHKPVIGFSMSRIAAFECELLQSLEGLVDVVFAWNVLPNHYHLLLQAPDLKELLKELGVLHGRTSYRWNVEQECQGRKVWHRAAETAMKSERHFWATMNYILHNAVHHGYVKTWQEWPFSSAAKYLEDIGREEAERRWREYPVLDYDKDWDLPDF
jgi:putative transposase